MQRPSTTSQREGHWSATHRKTAILGWLAFVVLAVGLSWAARSVKPETITSADPFAGESGQAERDSTTRGCGRTTRSS